MNHPVFTVSNQKEESIRKLRVNNLPDNIKRDGIDPNSTPQCLVKYYHKVNKLLYGLCVYTGR